ncbi:MAG TPA: inorganic phosphate transporter [Candidatus Saccharimonadales bacterium]|nr:inorganic phosphate transporter [Candidatus Saccharimonadales bacterium]
MDLDLTLVTVIILALFFDFTNGFHDTANAIATSIATKAVPPKVAVIAAAILNFLGAFVSLHVAATIATGIVNTEVITLQVILAGIVGAIIWNLFTWRFGLPTSSSHALIGGVAGSAIAAAGFGVIKWDGLSDKVLVPSLVAPLLGLIITGIAVTVIYRLIKKRARTKADKLFRRLQLVSGGFVAFTHGTNDAQKTMGIIALALIIANPAAEFSVPLWVIVSSALAMGIGTYLGGWRIIHTLGHRVVKLKPAQGFAAETSTATILWFTAHLGFPVSTTHTISGSILGAGAARKGSEVRWNIVKHILLAWIITIPCAGLVGASMNGISHMPGGASLVFSLVIVIAGTIYITRNWGWESFAQFKARLNFISRLRRSPSDV